MTSHTNEEGMDGLRANHVVTDYWEMKSWSSPMLCAVGSPILPRTTSVPHSAELQIPECSHCTHTAPCLGWLALLKINSAVHSLVTRFSNHIWGKNQSLYTAMYGNLHLS